MRVSNRGGCHVEWRRPDGLGITEDLFPRLFSADGIARGRLMGRFDGRSLAGRELDSIDIECHLKDATMVRSLAFKHLIAWGRQSTRLELLLEC